MLVDLFMFVLVRSGEEPLVGTQTHWIMFYQWVTEIAQKSPL